MENLCSILKTSKKNTKMYIFNSFILLYLYKTMRTGHQKYTEEAKKSFNISKYWKILDSSKCTRQRVFIDFFF